jgi:putative NADPH-quinone reductase
VRNGVAYEFRVGPNGKPGPVPLHKLRAALVINTGNTPMEAELALYGDPLDNLWKRCFGGMCGIPRTERLYFTSVIVSTPEQRAAWLAEVRARTAALFPQS